MYLVLQYDAVISSLDHYIDVRVRVRVVVVVMCEMDDECDGGRGHQWMGGVSVDGSFDHDWHFDGFFSFLALQTDPKKNLSFFLSFCFGNIKHIYERLQNPSELLRVITWVCVDPHPRSRNLPVPPPAVTSRTSWHQIMKSSLNQSFHVRRRPARRKNQRRRRQHWRTVEMEKEKEGSSSTPHPRLPRVSTNERMSSDAFSLSTKREI